MRKLVSVLILSLFVSSPGFAEILVGQGLTVATFSSGTANTSPAST